MRKRRVYLGALILAVAGVVALIVAGAFREREPEYGGKRLSEWVAMMGFMPGHMPGSVEYFKAKEAVGRIGTNAIPFLIGWVSYEQPGWKIRLVRLTAHFGSRGFVDRQALRADGAQRALMELGSRGRCAIPELPSRMVNAAGEQSAYRLAELLVNFGNPGVPALLAVTTNQHASARFRLRAAQYIPGWTNYTPETVSALQELSTNWEVGGDASILLREIEAERGRSEAMAQRTK